MSSCYLLFILGQLFNWWGQYYWKRWNTVVSMLHHFLAVHTQLGWEDGALSLWQLFGPKQNQFLMYCMMYWILCGLHDDIKMSFLPLGLTMFSSDWCFELFRRYFRRLKVGCLDHVVRVVNESTTTNVAQLVG